MGIIHVYAHDVLRTIGRSFDLSANRNGDVLGETRLSKLLFNSSIAVVASACLVKGIVEVSGRTTSVDIPYWYVAAGLLCLSVMTGFIRPRKLA